MRVAVCLYGDVRASVLLADQLRQFAYDVDVYVHKKFVDPYPAELAPRCYWLEEPRTFVNRPEGVSEKQMWVYWSMARLGKMVIQTEQREGRYGLIAFVSPDCYLAKLPTPLVDGKVHTTEDPGLVAIGPSTDMQLYLNKISQLQAYREKFPDNPFVDGEFAAWCLNGRGEKRLSNWLEDLR